MLAALWAQAALASAPQRAPALPPPGRPHLAALPAQLITWQVLPPGAAQVQPLVEAFFVLADVRHKLRPAEELEAGERSRDESGRRGRGCAGGRLALREVAGGELILC